MDLNELVFYFFKKVNEQTQGISVMTLFIMALEAVIFVNLISFIFGRVTGRKVSVERIVAWSLLGAYACFMYQVTFYNRDIGSRDTISAELNFGALNGNFMSEQQFVYSVLNVLLFLPLGVISGWLKKNDTVKRRVFMCTISSFLISFLIECVQLLTMRGHFELVDILTNTAGGFIGSVLVSIVIAVSDHFGTKNGEC